MTFRCDLSKYAACNSIKKNLNPSKYSAFKYDKTYSHKIQFFKMESEIKGIEKRMQTEVDQFKSIQKGW